MPSAFLQWLYADAADVPQTGYEVSRNSDPMSPKFTRPRNSASGSTLMHFSNTVGRRKGRHEDYDVTFTVLGDTLVGKDKQNTYYKGYTLPGNAFLFQLKNNDKNNPKGEHFAMYNTQYFASETERRIVGPYLLIDSDKVP